MEKKIRFYNVDFLRFLLAVQIVVRHQICKWAGLDDFTALVSSKFNLWSIAVEFFFILAGFFMFLGIKKETDTLDFAKKRFLRLAPLVWFLVIISAIISPVINVKFSYDGNILTIPLMHSIGFTPTNITGGTINGTIWFVSVLFWCSLFYFYIYKIFDKKYLNLIIASIIVFCYGTILNFNHFSYNIIVKNVFYFCNTGVLRGLAGLGVGYFIAMFYKSGFLQNCTKKVQAFISVIEFGLVGFFTYYLFFSPKLPGKTAMTYIICFSTLFYLFLVKQGFISRLLDNKYLAKLGQYSYSIYVMHSAVLCTILYTIFKPHLDFVQSHLALCFWGELAITIVIGILTYYFIESPVNKFITQKFLKH